MVERIEQAEGPLTTEELIETLADAVALAADYFNARDEMNGAVMRPAINDGIPHQAPITRVINEALEAWRSHRYGEADRRES